MVNCSSMAEPWLVFQLPEIDLRLNMEINDKQKTIMVIIELNYARTGADDDDGGGCLHPERNRQNTYMNAL